MIMVDEEGTGTNQEMSCRIKDIHAELKSGGYPGGEVFDRD